MSRFVCVNVSFQNHLYSAIVTIKDKGNDLYCSVRYLDESLHHILPGSFLEFNLIEGLKTPENLNSEGAVELVSNTSRAITEYLQIKF